MSMHYEPPEPLKPGKRPGHDRDDSRQEREKDYVKQVRHPQPGTGHERHSVPRGRTHH